VGGEFLLDLLDGFLARYGTSDFGGLKLAFDTLCGYFYPLVV
jgi:hypothetical protein